MKAVSSQNSALSLCLDERSASCKLSSSCGIQVKLMVMMRVGVFLLICCLTPVWAISYTVQLFASSDEARASQLQAQLAGQGYPAYLLSVPTAQGQVYRIRVGAFGNRAAAALFAQVMPSVEGSTPSPALAEGGVPPGLIPLQLALLGQYDIATTLVQIFPWPVLESPVLESAVPETPQEVTEQEVTEAVTPENEAASLEDESSSGESPATSEDDVQTSEATDETSSEAPLESEGESSSGPASSSEAAQQSSDETEVNGATEVVAQNAPDETDDVTQEVAPLMVIRVQPKDASEQALYRLGDLEFAAWRAAPIEDGRILRVRSFSVWPEEWQTASEAERDQYRETVLANLSGDLDLTPQQLEPFVFELDNKAPFVVLVERFDPETQQTERLRSIGQPRPNQENLGLGPQGPATFLGEAVDIPSPDEASVFEPDERTPIPDELLGNGWQAGNDDEFVTLTLGDKTWRAAVGQSLWASAELLISFYEGQILVYQIQQP